jgi:F0F1-type ATP synthase assembly protein I
MIEGPPNPKELGYYFSLAQVGVEMVFPVGVGVLLDRYFQWHPWGTIIGAVVGFVGGFMHLILLVNQHDAGKRSKPGGDQT